MLTLMRNGKVHPVDADIDEKWEGASVDADIDEQLGCISGY